LYLKDNITLGEGRGNTFITFLKEGRIEEIAVCYKLLKQNLDYDGNYARGQAGERCENLWK
jgi:hypothetical protein